MSNVLILHGPIDLVCKFIIFDVYLSNNKIYDCKLILQTECFGLCQPKSSVWRINLQCIIIYQQNEKSTQVYDCK